MCAVDSVDELPERTMMWVRVARKAHKCEDCSREIREGEPYHAALWEMSDGYVTAKQCLHCRMAAGWLDVVCGGWLWCGVLFDLEEHIDELGRFIGDPDGDGEWGYPELQLLVNAGNAKWLDGQRLMSVADVEVLVRAALAVLPEEAKPNEQ